MFCVRDSHTQQSHPGGCYDLLFQPFKCQLWKEPTLMPAERHLPTASGTAARGGSIIDMRPTKQRLSVWKFTSSVSKAKPLGYFSSDMKRWQKPGGRRDEIEWMKCTIQYFSKYTKFQDSFQDRLTVKILEDFEKLLFLSKTPSKT